MYNCIYDIPHKYGLDNRKFKAYRILLKSERRATEPALGAIHYQQFYEASVCCVIYCVRIYYFTRDN